MLWVCFSLKCTYIQVIIQGIVNLYSKYIYSIKIWWLLIESKKKILCHFCATNRTDKDSWIGVEMLSQKLRESFAADLH